MVQDEGAGSRHLPDIVVVVLTEVDIVGIHIFCAAVAVLVVIWGTDTALA